jgi:hypothetical protein
LAADNDSVASVSFLVDGTQVGADTSGADGWSVQWNSNAVANGNHALTAVARDAAGNAATSAARQVLVSNASSLIVPVRAGTDDADELQNGTIDRTKGDLELGTDLGVPTTVGLRFTGVAVPRGATITRSHVQFQVDETRSTAASLTVRAQQADNAGAFTTAAFNLSSRPVTTAFVGWSAPAWPTVGTAGADQRTPDLRAVLQEVVNRSGWSSGNALVLLITGSGRRTAESFEGGAPPVLHVEYSQP